MSFPKAPIKRFNEASTCAPPPGSYDIKTSDPSKGPVSFEKSQRFKMQMEDGGVQPNPSNMKPVPSPATTRKLPSLSARPKSIGTKSDKSLIAIKELKKQKELEKEIRILIGIRAQQHKRLQVLEEDLAKSELKLSAAVREKNTLLANVASLEKQLLELRKSNDLLKTKMVPAKSGDMKIKLNVVQGTMEEKLAQPEKLTETERLVEEKYDSEKLLECSIELGNVAEEDDDKYKLHILQLQEIIESKNKDIETLESNLHLKETMLSTQSKELNGKCKILEEQKEKCVHEYEEKNQVMNAEIQCLKEKLSIEEQEHQKQKMIFQETSADMHQKLLKFQEEIAKEREILKTELKEAMDELDKLHTKEAKVEKLLKHLEQVNEFQNEELSQLETKLQRKSAELEEMAVSHKNIIEKLQGEYNQLQFKFGETSAEFENYKVCMTEEITCLKQDKAVLQERLTEMNRTVQNATHAMQEEQHAKDQAKEDYMRVLLDSQTKIAQKDAEIDKIKELSTMQIANLQAKLEQQSEELNKKLEIERKIITEKIGADYKKNIKTWRALYEDLYNKVKPFQQQLDAYEAEKNALLNEHGATQEELNKISDAYAKLLGHQNQKQKIKHVMKLKDENTQLKQDLLKLRAQIAKEKQAREELQDEINEIQGVRRFDPSKAFQHPSKENIVPKTPFKESNRNKNQAVLH
ncbi:hyaluronan mediated motility receptor [Ahaetulla prasina]|uniref:hyaluronan mediated motility receptor n=1 Tax=Ahaetulla prasina TaxID=499056 RepID=UPI00264946E2|nr:hyaluronan mediated motility receptor [Ahaetulla prasina]